MAITKLNTRLMQKYDTEENWGKASGFIPLKGEKIIYAPDDTHPYVREKTGDGVTAVTALPFDENYRGDTISSNQTGASLYVKLCTVQSLAAHSDIFIEFDMAGRSFERFQKVKFIPRRDAATTTPTCAVFVSGGKGNPYQVRAYQYQFKNIENDYIELWCVLPGYDVLNILKRSFASNWKSAEQNFIWNYEVANAWPTESESVIKVNAIMEEWTGNSATATTATTATKLKTARTISLGGGATGTATSFDGTGNITIPVTKVKESCLSWGDLWDSGSISGRVSPIDAACSNIHSANRFAFANPDGITIEYSTNGSTYSTYNTTDPDSDKINLVSGIGSKYYIGARRTSTTVNDKLRITLNATNMGLYINLKKLLINISTNHATGSNVILERALKGSETTYKTVATYQISGWSGWNSIPVNVAFGGGNNQTENVASIRLTFGITGVNTAQTANALQVLDIIGIGDVFWSCPSTMARTGHLYSYDSSQNATFPANVTANTFVGALSGNASSATTATQDGNGNVISTTYATKDEVSDTYLTKTKAIQTYATKTSVSSTYLTKTDAGNTYATKDEEFITVEDIDTICGTTIEVATLSEVTF